MTADPRKEKKSSGQNARRPGRDHLVTGGGIIQESLGAIIPLQTGGFVGIGKLPYGSAKTIDTGPLVAFIKEIARLNRRAASWTAFAALFEGLATIAHYYGR